MSGWQAMLMLAALTIGPPFGVCLILAIDDWVKREARRAEADTPDEDRR